jgi:hypothetical protein
MVRLTPGQRVVFGEKLLDLGNYAAAAMVFGQFVSQQRASPAIIVSGVATWIVFVLWAFWVMGER